MFGKVSLCTASLSPTATMHDQQSACLLHLGRNKQQDEMTVFQEMDNVDYAKVANRVRLTRNSNNIKVWHGTSFIIDDSPFIQLDDL